jgi:hypothetical protein
MSRDEEVGWFDMLIRAHRAGKPETDFLLKEMELRSSLGWHGRHSSEIALAFRKYRYVLDHNLQYVISLLNEGPNYAEQMDEVVRMLNKLNPKWHIYPHSGYGIIPIEDLPSGKMRPHDVQRYITADGRGPTPTFVVMVDKKGGAGIKMLCHQVTVYEDMSDIIPFS